MMQDPLVIKRGDSWPIEIAVRVDGARISSPEGIETFNLTLGGISYKWDAAGSGRVTWDAEASAFVFFPTQAETFALPVPTTYLDWRVKFADGIVDGCKSGKIPIRVVDSDSLEVL